MASEGEYVELGTCLEMVIDHRGKTPKKLGADWVERGVPTISAKNVNGGRLVAEDAIRHVSQEVYMRWMKDDVKRGDCFLVSEGATLGECMLWDEDYPVVLGQRIFCLRANPAVLYPRYLYSYMTSANFQSEIIARATGTSVDGLRQTEVLKMKIKLLPMEQQRRIGDTLYFLNAKIELNRRMNETLEGLARAIFQSWFVDFDGVRRNVELKSEGGRVKSETSAPSPFTLPPSNFNSLFPDSFEDSELGKIPKGWKVGCVGDVGSNPRRTINPADIKPGTPYIALEHMPRRSIALADWSYGDEIASGKCQFHRGKILFGKLRPYFHKVGVPAINGVCSTDILVVVPKSPPWFGFLLGQISSDELIAFTDMASTGTKMPRTSWGDISRYQIVLPPESVAKVFTSQVQELVSQIHANIHESRTLAAIRDALLPKLLSGEIRVAEAELLVEGV